MELHCRAGDGAGAMEGAEGFAKLACVQADAAALRGPLARRGAHQRRAWRDSAREAVRAEHTALQDTTRTVRTRLDRTIRRIEEILES